MRSNGNRFIVSILSLMLIFSNISGVFAEGAVSDNTPTAKAEEQVEKNEPKDASDVKTAPDKEESPKAEKTLEESAAEVEDADKAEKDAEKSETVQEKAEEPEETEAKPDATAFSENVKIDDVTITVEAAKGVFPNDCTLFVQKIEKKAELKEVKEAVSAEKKSEKIKNNVAESFTYDIKVLNKDGKEIQPDGEVNVSFRSDLVKNENLDTAVYHIEEQKKGLVASSLEVSEDETKKDEYKVVSDGFSRYVVEFTYNELTYVMEGDSEIPLSDVLDYVGLMGEVSDARGSNDELFSFEEKDGTWYVIAHEAFDTQEWMKVTIDGIVYDVVVTDAGSEMYAEFDSSTGVLRIFRYVSGVYTDGQVVGTKTYWTGIEDITGDTNSKWYAKRESVTKVVIEDVFRPQTAYQMFYGMRYLTEIQGLENLDTSYVRNMRAMFFRCDSLTTLDLSSFDTSIVTDMSMMFVGCYELRTIYVSNLWSTDAVTESTAMFFGNSKLVGGQGTTCDGGQRDKTYAKIDGGPSDPGYLTLCAPGMPGMYAEFDSSTGVLRIFEEAFGAYTDGQVVGTKTYWTGIEDITGETNPKWYAKRTSVTKVVIEDTFKPQTAYYMFNGMQNLTEIQGLENLDTSNVTSMASMFSSCTSLTTLDLSSFDTSNVTNMGWMFVNCLELRTIYVSNLWSTDAVTQSSAMMFLYATKLVGGKGTTYNSNYVDTTRAKIDGGPSDPGYLTSNIPSYMVTYNANGGSNAPETQYKDLGVSLTLTTDVPTRSGYSFKNWNTEADGSGASYAPGGTYTADESTTLYAQWKGIISPTVTISNWTYGGTASTPSVSGNTGNGAVTYQYKVQDAADSTYTTTKPTNAGNYTIKATIAETSNYDSGTATANFTINKASISPSVSMSGWTYGGTASNPSVSGNTGSGSVTYEYKTQGAADSTYTTTKPSTAGSYTVRATIAATTNYNGGTATANFTISKANITPSVSMSGWTYGGTASSPSVSGNTGGGSVTYEYKVSTADDSTYTTTKPSNAGTYTVRATVAATTNYNSGTATTNFTIAKATPSLTFTSPQSVSKTFSASSQTASLTAATGNQGTLSYAIQSQKDSGDSAVSYFTLSGTTLTVAANTPAGTYTVVVRATDAGTSNYNSTTKDATVNVTISKASMAATPTAYSAAYDGSAHSAKIKVNVAGATVSYGTSTSYGKTLTATNANTDYTMSEVTRTNAGTTTVYYKVSKANYNDVTGSTTITISKQDISPTVTINGWTYGGTASNPSVSGNSGNGSVTYEYKVKGAADSTYSSTKPSNAGTYTVRATVAATSNYNGGTATADFTIAKATNPLAYASTQSASKTFSTSSQTAALSAATNNQGSLSYAIQSQKNSGDTTVNYFTLSGTTLTIAASTPTGTYTVVVRATAAGNDNYNSGTKDSTVTVTVNKSGITPTVTMNGWTYGDTASNPSVSGNTGGGSVTYEYKVSTAADSTYTTTKPSNAGTYTVRATIAASGNYDGGTATANFTIAKAANPLTYATTQSVSKTFSTSAQTASLTAATGAQGTLGYAINSQKNSGGTTVSYFTLSGTTLTIAANTPVGTYTVVVRATAAGNDNYNSGTKDSTVTVTVGKADISPSVSMAGWTYGGTASNPSVSGNPGSGAVTYQYKVQNAADSTYTDTKPSEAGNYTVKATVAATSNYNGGTATTNFTIAKDSNPLAYTSTQSVSKTFSTSSQTATLTAATNAQGALSYAIQSQKKDSDTVSYFSLSGTALTLAANTPAGIYTIVIRATAAGNNNYNSETKDSTVTVTVGKANISPSVSISGWTYGETASNPSVSGNPGNGSVTYEYKAQGAADSTYSATKPSNAGTYTVRATIAATANYNGDTATANFTIAKASNPLTYASTQSVSKTFSTSAQTASLTAATNAQGSLSYAIQSQKKGSDTVNYFTLNETTLNIAANTPAGTYTVVIRATAAGNDNYNSGTKDSTVTVTIGKANISPSVSMSGWTYGGTASTPSVSGNPESGNVTYEYKVSTAADSTYSATKPSNAGTYTVRATVAATSNYNGGTATTNFTISKANISPSVSINGWTYGGTASDPSVSGNSGNGTVTYEYKVKDAADSTYSSTKPSNAGTYTVKATIAATSNYNGGTATRDFTIAKANNTLTLSANSGSTTYPNNKAFAVTANTSGGALSVDTDNSAIATASISGTTVMITPGTTAGKTTITVTSAATSNYKAGTATYEITVAKGTITVTPVAYTNEADGTAHSAKLKSDVAGVSVQYGESASYGKTLTMANANTEYALSEVTRTVPGETTVYYKVSKTGYEDATGTVKITLTDTTEPTVKITPTNNNAPSQTVTLTATDTNGLAGYYWGTEENPTSYAEITGNLNVNKTVTESGIYYLKVKDVSGNIATKSLAFYKTTFSATHGTVSKAAVLTAAGNSFTTATISPDTGYEAPTKWNQQINVNASYAPQSNENLSAVCTSIRYTISYNLDGGSQTNPKTEYNIETETFTLTEPKKDGYIFTGWTGSNGNTPQKTVTVNKGSTGNLSYTANWEEELPVPTGVDSPKKFMLIISMAVMLMLLAAWRLTRKRA